MNGTGLKFYKVMETSRLLYNNLNWITKQTDISRLQVSDMKFLSERMYKIGIHNEETRIKLKISSEEQKIHD